MGRLSLEKAVELLPPKVVVILCAHLLRTYLPFEKTEILNDLYKSLNLNIRIKE